jgi:hypothetical protein
MVAAFMDIEGPPVKDGKEIAEAKLVLDDTIISLTQARPSRNTFENPFTWWEGAHPTPGRPRGAVVGFWPRGAASVGPVVGFWPRGGASVGPVVCAAVCTAFGPRRRRPSPLSRYAVVHVEL